MKARLGRPLIRRRSLITALIAAIVGGAAATLVDEGVRERFGLAPETRGAARVVDGDSLRMGDTRIRLLGIDAPELRQTCRRAGTEWACGAEARDALRRLSDGREIACTPRGRDRNGRVLAVCRAPGIADLGARLVADGWAVAFDTRYTTEEADARRLGKGLWSGTFDPPREWRRVHRGSMQGDEEELAVED